MDKADLFKLLKRAMDAFYTRDMHMIKIGGLERTCAARIAGYMQHIIDTEWPRTNICVDCEYGRTTDQNGEQLQKTLLRCPPVATGNTEPVRVYPDIIVHERGTHKNNLLVIEIKGYWSNNHDAWDYDDYKLSEFTKQRPDITEQERYYYCYTLGVFVVLGANQAHFIQFENGHQTSGTTNITDLFYKRTEL